MYKSKNILLFKSLSQNKIIYKKNVKQNKKGKKIFFHSPRKNQVKNETQEVCELSQLTP